MEQRIVVFYGKKVEDDDIVLLCDVQYIVDKIQVMIEEEVIYILMEIVEYYSNDFSKFCLIVGVMFNIFIVDMNLYRFFVDDYGED